MTPEIAHVVSAQVQVHAQRYHRRWPGVPLDDLVQQGWLVALEALTRRTTLGPGDGAYVGRAVALALQSHVYRVTCPVHLPSKKESSVAGPGRPVQITGAELPPDQLEDGPAVLGVTGELARALVVAVTTRYPWARPVLLELRTLEDQGLRSPGGQVQLAREARRARKLAGLTMRQRVDRVSPALVQLTTECPQVRGLLLGRRTLAQVLAGPVDPWVVARVLAACQEAL